MVSHESSVSPSEQDALIRAVLAMKQLMATGDAKKIRAYLLKAQGSDPKAVEAYTTVSEAEIKEVAAMIAGNPVTESELRASTTEWQIQGNTATIIIHRSPTEELELTLRNVDGVWY